ncbi:phage recombination protein Bet [Mesorhizobium sp. Cs1299R1N3]|uniref:phage recombination protein Bet n=1 Tax=Mesorhizobium sp. Cs1299R1N3 TaxID=3015173 RepID=UPI00301C1192
MHSNAVTSINRDAGLSPTQIRLVKDTIAKDCNDTEFDLFMEVARSMRLNPFRSQILPMVFGKKAKDTSKRRMSIIVSRDGLRVIASRCRNYRPASEPAIVEYDEALKGPGNPKGIVKVTIKLHQQDNAGTWWPVVGEAYWDEFAPLKYAADAYEETGECWPDGNPIKRLKAGAVPTVLDDGGNWPKMPFVMITKCAEAQALRAGWPEEFGGVYAEEEMDRARVIDQMSTASEIVHEAERKAREERINKTPSLLVCFNGQTAELESVPVDQFADRVLAWTRGCDAEAVRSFMERNRHPLREFWAKSPTDALALKKELEVKVAAQ